MFPVSPSITSIYLLWLRTGVALRLSNASSKLIHGISCLGHSRFKKMSAEKQGSKPGGVRYYATSNINLLHSTSSTLPEKFLISFRK